MPQAGSLVGANSRTISLGSLRQSAEKEICAEHKKSNHFLHCRISVGLPMRVTLEGLQDPPQRSRARESLQG